MIQSDNEKSNKNPKKTKKYFIFLLFFLGCMEMIDTYVTVFPTMISSNVMVYFTIEPGFYSVLIGIASIGTFISVLIQFMADIWGRRIFLAISLIGMGFASILMFLSNSIEKFIFSLFLLFIFYGADIYTIYIAEEAPKEKRSMYTNCVMVFGTIGALVTFLLRVIFIKDTLPVGNWKMLTVFGFVAIPLAFFVIKVKETTAFEELKKRRDASGYKNKLGFSNFLKPFDSENRDSFIVVLLISFIIGLNASMVLLGESIMDVRFTKDEVSLGLAIAMLVVTILYLITGWSSDKYGRKPIFYIFSIFFPIGMGIIVLGLNLSQDYLAYAVCLVGISICIAFPQCLAIQTRILCVETLPTGLRGIGTAWRSIVAAAGTSIGLIFNGFLTYVFESINLPYAMSISAALIGITFFLNIPIIAFFMKETKGIDVNEF